MRRSRSVLVSAKRILRGDRESILNRMQITAPLLLEAIPLTLEEIFIYELGGADYAVRDIVL